MDNAFEPRVRQAEILEALREAFEEALSKALGASAKDAIIYHLTKKLEGDPFQILHHDPKTFHNALFAIFGQGTQLIIKLLAEELNRKYEVDVSAETLLHYMTTEDKTQLIEWQQLLNKTLTNQQSQSNQ